MHFQILLFKYRINLIVKKNEKTKNPRLDSADNKSRQKLSAFQD